ncbi:MAG: Ig-like domain-containing protein [Halanaerobiales bacterium]
MVKRNRISLCKILLVLILFMLLPIIFIGCSSGLDIDNNDETTPDPISSNPEDPLPIVIGETIEADYVTVNEVTYYFDDFYTVGMFANGDYWVVGPIKIERITPDYTDGYNGWEVNPLPGAAQGFDKRVDSYDPGLVPELPYTAESGDSIVKTISKIPQGAKVCIKSAVVLTVVDEVPPGNGADVFRPSYVGEEKPYHYLSEIDRSVIPLYDSSDVNHVPSLETVKGWFENVQLDHFGDGRNQYARPEENLPGYGAAVATRTANAALRLMLGGSDEEYMPALIAYLQCGVDYYYMMEDGWIWTRGGGESPGNKLPLAFFVTVMGNEEMQEIVRDRKMYEDYHLYYGKNGIALFGDWGWKSRGSHPPTEAAYWNMVAYDSGSRTNYDPYQYIDGGVTPGASYHQLMSQPFKGTALALLLMPEMRRVWNADYLFDYADRWVHFGAWTLPDPLAPVDGETAEEKDANWKKTWGYDPDNPGVGIRNNKGRFPERHGSNTDTGHYGSKFYSSMWDVYRPLAPGAEQTPPFAAIISNLEGETVSGDQEILASAYSIHGIQSVQFRVDGGNIGGPASQITIDDPTDIDLSKKNLPYKVMWDTSQVSNGNHELTVIATDERNNTYESIVVNVNVQN